MTAKGWIDGDETAGDMLSRLLTEQLPFLLLPPLHRLPLRVGNVVEVVGPSASAKTQILMQAAISCILPKEWNGVHYGGLGRLVMFIDLDCRFDVLRLSQMLKHRIMEANGLSNEVQRDEKVGDLWNCHSKSKPSTSCDEELFALCMRRFLYVRCYDSFEFLATLKTSHCRLQQESEAHGISFYFLMIDSIGAFHWIDRACRPLPARFNNRKSLSLQCLSETVVREIRNLLLVHPMVVIATKAIITVDKNSANDVKWRLFEEAREEDADSKKIKLTFLHEFGKFGKWFAPDMSYSDNVKSNTEHFQYHEYMPSVWQTLVTQRIVVQPTGEHCATSEDQELSVYLSQWLLPPLKSVDKFAVGDAGVIIVS